MTASLTNMKPAILAVFIVFGIAIQCGRADAAPNQTAIFAGGCFWCVEADFESVDGVKSAVSGFAGGTVANPTYKQVTKGGTGHYEAVRITYDPDVVSYETLLHLFFRSVDPTDAGGQFCDRGDSYRTAIFVANKEEAAAAKAAKAKAQRELRRKIVTPILAAGPFYTAEKYHQDYAKKSDIILTRFGPRSKAEAYKRYRKGCGRDKRVRQLWGSEAPFAG